MISRFLLLLICYFISYISCFAQVNKHNKNQVIEYWADSTVKLITFTDSLNIVNKKYFDRRGKLVCHGTHCNANQCDIKKYYNIDGKVILTTSSDSVGFKKNVKPIGLNQHEISHSFNYDSSGINHIQHTYKEGQIAAIYKFDQRRNLSDAIYMNMDGSIIGEVKFKGEFPLEGTHVTFYTRTDKIYLNKDSAMVKSVEQFVERTKMSAKYYTKNGEFLGECEYKSRKPFNGKHLVTDILAREYRLENYVNYHVTEVMVYDLDFVLYTIRTYEKGQIVKEEVGPKYPDEKHRFKGTFHRGEKFSGTFLTNYGYENYTMGVKTGPEYLFDLTTLNFKSKTEFKFDVKNGQCIQYTPQGAILCEGWYKNDIPDHGRFLTNEFYNYKKIDTYRGGILQKTEIILMNKDSSASIEYTTFAECIYRDGKPWEGTEYDQESRYTSYASGKKHGISYQMDRNMDTTSIETYKDGVLHGFYGNQLKNEVPTNETRCYYENGSVYSGYRYDSQKNELQHFEGGKLKKIEFTIGQSKCISEVNEKFKDGVCNCKININNVENEISGIYKNDKPWSGKFIENKSIVEYLGGKKHGVSTTYNAYFSFPLESKTYSAGMLDGRSVYLISNMIDYKVLGDSIEGLYEKGKLVNGYESTYDRDLFKTTYIKYENQSPTGDSIVMDSYGNLSYKKGKRMDGFYHPYGIYHSNFKLTYSNGINIKTQAYYMNEMQIDQVCNDTICNGTNRKRTFYTWKIKPSNNGLQKVTYFDIDGNTMHEGFIENERLKSGCFIFEHYDRQIGSSPQWTHCKICINQKSKTTLEVHYSNTDIYHVFETNQKNLNLPFPLTHVVNLIDMQLKQQCTVTTFSTIDSTEICTAEYEGQRLVNGAYISDESGRKYNLEINKNSNFSFHSGISMYEVKLFLSNKW